MPNFISLRCCVQDKMLVSQNFTDKPRNHDRSQKVHKLNVCWASGERPTTFWTICFYMLLALVCFAWCPNPGTNTVSDWPSPGDRPSSQCDIFFSKTYFSRPFWNSIAYFDTWLHTTQLLTGCTLLTQILIKICTNTHKIHKLVFSFNSGLWQIMPSFRTRLFCRASPNSGHLVRPVTLLLS